MNTTAVMIVGHEETSHSGAFGPRANVVVHVFKDGELESTAKFNRVPMMSMGELQNFLGRYTEGKFSMIRTDPKA